MSKTSTKSIGRRFLLTAEQAGFGLSQYNLRDTIISDSCPAEPACVGALASSVYRTLDGSCNNLRRGGWGMSKTQFQRGLAAQYADGQLPLPILNCFFLILAVTFTRCTRSKPREIWFNSMKLIKSWVDVSTLEMIITRGFHLKEYLSLQNFSNDDLWDNKKQLTRT